MTEKFDVIIVGAGPGGSAAAYSLAKMGFNVLMVERDKYPGAKNVMGGRMYAHALNRLIPSFWKDAPIERLVTKKNSRSYAMRHLLPLIFRTGSFGNHRTASLYSGRNLINGSRTKQWKLEPR